VKKTTTSQYSPTLPVIRLLYWSMYHVVSAIAELLVLHTMMHWHGQCSACVQWENVFSAECKSHHWAKFYFCRSGFNHRKTFSHQL